VFAIGLAAPNICSGYENVPGFSTVSEKKLEQPEYLFKTETCVVCCKPRQHVSKSKSWEQAHQQITALHFTSLAYWPRPHATM